MTRTFPARDNMMPTISRRGLILGSASAAGLAFAFPLSAGTGDTITVDQFRVLSARLTGASLGDLDRGAAAKLLAGFISMGRELISPASPPILERAPGHWQPTSSPPGYSGTFETSAGLATIGLTNALLWHALHFTKPRGICGGATGYWALAPQA
jgi:hypothetical protein